MAYIMTKWYLSHDCKADLTFQSKWEKISFQQMKKTCDKIQHSIIIELNGISSTWLRASSSTIQSSSDLLH